MKMKYLLVALVVLLALAGVAAADSSVEIRSTVLDYTALATSSPFDEITALDWAGFYYNLDDGLGTETMTFVPVATNKLTIDYHTQREYIDYAFPNWTDGGSPPVKLQYAIIGFFAEPYVALNGNANKIAPLVIDSNDKFVLGVGQELDIGYGYSIMAQQIDVNGNKAYLQLMKDGQVIDSGIINANGTTADSKTWTLEKDAAGEKNVEYLRICVNQVFQGTQSSLVEIKGLWAADINSAFEVKSDVDYGKWEAGTMSNTALNYQAKEVALGSNITTELGKGIIIKTGKNYSTNHMFYLAKVYTDPGNYTIRSTIYNYTSTATPITYNYENFAAFYYDLDTDKNTEFMEIAVFNGTKIDKGDLTYWTEPDFVEYAYNGWGDNKNYWIMGLFGQSYVPFNMPAGSGLGTAGSDNNLAGQKMGKLVLDSSDKYVLGVGQTLDLGEGYSMVAQQIDVNGNKAYLQFFKDGQQVDSGIVNTDTSSNDSKTWEITMNLLGEKDVQVLRVQVAQVFQGTQSSLVEIKGIWLMDYKNARELKTSDSFGSFDFDSYSDTGAVVGPGPVLSFSSNKDVSLSRDANITLYDNFGILTSKNTDNFFFYTIKTVGDDEAPTNPVIPEEPPEIITPPENNTTNNTPPENNTTPQPQPEPTKSFWSKYWWVIVLVIVIIIVAAGGYIYWAKKNGKM